MKCIGLAMLIVLGCGSAMAQRVGAPTDDLSRVGVEELFSLEVTSVGRKAQEMSKAPAAVFVLTAEDIRRSGAVSLPEVLRWAPGLTALSSDDRSWVVSARGSARLYSNKILVLVDGRSLYTPLFSGVIWDAVDVPLGDIERIEVVRGPGAVMWGPHAVNGVINIITRKAQQTKGVRTSLASGNALRGSAEGRWGGGSADDRMALRAWGKLDYQIPAFGSRGLYYFNTFQAIDPRIADLDTASGRMGFRLDFQPSENRHLMVQGDLFKRDRQDAMGVPGVQPNVIRSQAHTDYSGGYFQARWTLGSGSGSESELQFSYDRTNLGYPYLIGKLNNLTVDFQRRVQAGERNEIYWGAGVQQYWDDTREALYVGFNPASSVVRSADVVLRDEWQIVRSRLTASAGMRLDTSTFARLEYEPSLRLLYTPDAKHSAWVAVSRATRTPDRFDRGIEGDNGFIPGGPLPIHQSIHGSPDFESEIERVAEGGFRMQSGQRWSWDVSLFAGRYERLRAVAGGVPVAMLGKQGVYLDLPVMIHNLGEGHSYGGEIWSTIQVRPGWRLMPGYWYVRDQFRLPPAEAMPVSGWDRQPSDLRHQGALRSRHDLSRHWQLDLMARARDRDRAFPVLPGVLLVDARLAWQSTRGAEVSFTCRNLTNRQVMEAIAEGTQPSIPVRRILLMQWTQRF